MRSRNNCEAIAESVKFVMPNWVLPITWEDLARFPVWSSLAAGSQKARLSSGFSTPECIDLGHYSSLKSLDLGG